MVQIECLNSLKTHSYISRFSNKREEGEYFPVKTVKIKYLHDMKNEINKLVYFYVHRITSVNYSTEN